MDRSQASHLGQALNCGHAGTWSGAHPIATPPESKILTWKGNTVAARAVLPLPWGCRWSVEPLGSLHLPPRCNPHHPLPSTQKLHRGELLWTPSAVTFPHPPPLGVSSANGYFPSEVISFHQLNSLNSNGLKLYLNTQMI